jgi:hypothetical protein
MERRNFFSKLLALPLLAVPATMSQEKPSGDGPAMVGTPVCACGSYMLGTEYPLPQEFYCTNKYCRYFEVRYRMSKTPMERA